MNLRGGDSDNSEADRTAFQRRSLDLVGTSVDVRRSMLQIASTRDGGEYLEDLESIFAWIEEIESGDPRVMYEIALRLRDGDGLPKHRAASLIWLQRAGDHGVPDALYAAARVKLDEPGRGSRGFVGDYLLKQAAHAGHPFAQREYGLRLFARSEDEDDSYKAYAWLLLAQANGAEGEDDTLAEAMASLSEEPRQRIHAVVQRARGKSRLPMIWPLAEEVSARERWREELRVALRWGECAGALAVLDDVRRDGDAEAEHELALLYEEGTCVEQDFGLALEHYRQAVGDGHVDSALPEALMFYEGRGAPRDLVAARHWFKASALTLVRGYNDPDERLRDARLRMPERYYNNLPSELLAEIDWLVGIENGDPRILHETALQVRDGDGLPRDRLAAESWLAAAGKRGIPEAYFDLGLRRLNDPIRPRDPEFGIIALAAAGRDGFVPAQVELGRRYAAGTRFNGGITPPTSGC